MEFVKEIVRKRSFSIFGNAYFVDSAIRKMVLSGLFLNDHIEVLEQSGVIPSNIVDISTMKFVNNIAMGGIILSSLAVCSLKKNRIWLGHFSSIAALTYGIFFAVKVIQVFRNKLSQHRLDETIIYIKHADLAIQKNLTFLRESKYLCTEEYIFPRCAEQDQTYLSYMIEIIRIVYAEVKLLELISIPEHMESVYDPLDELSNCIHFQENNVILSNDTFKTFHNIFLYFQSQYFLRLCLILVFDREKERGVKYLNDENIQFRKKLKVHTEHLGSWIDAKIQKILSQKKLDLIMSQNVNKNKREPTDLMRMKRCSSEMMFRLIDIVNKFQCIDQQIQSFKPITIDQELISISTALSQVEVLITTHLDDLHSLDLILNKLSAKNGEVFIAAEESHLTDKNTNTEISKTIYIKDEPNFERENEEYFGMRDINDWEENETHAEDGVEKMSFSSIQDAPDDIDKKLTHLSFAPVLKQLKSKIGPIREQMKERELKFLIAKGIDCAKIIEYDKNEYTVNSESTQINISKHDRYGNMRLLLQQKNQIQLIPQQNLPSSSIEDVLE